MYIYIYIYIHIERERERERERDDTSLVPVWGCICSSSVAPFAGPARWDLAQAAKRQVRSQDIYIYIYIYIYSYRYMYVCMYIYMYIYIYIYDVLHMYTHAQTGDV